MDRKFAKLTTSIYQSLISSNISKDQLTACLMGFSCTTKVFDGSDQSMFRKQRKKFEDTSATVATVWSIIGDYISFFDYDILEMIADTLGTEQDKLKIAEYKNDFEAYAKRRVFIDDVSSQSDPSLAKESSTSTSENEDTCSKARTSMFVMLDPSYDDCEIGHLKRLQNKFSSILNLKKGVLQLRKVRKGSVQLVLVVPDFLVDIIFPLSSDQESALGELGVTQLDCGDYHFRAKV